MIKHCCMCDDNKAEVAELKALIKTMGLLLEDVHNPQITPGRWIMFITNTLKILNNPTVKRIMEEQCHVTP